MARDDDYQQLGDFEDDDVEEPDFEGQTQAGGWWSAERTPDRRAHPRVPFNARIELIPPDGNVHHCGAVNLSLGGVLLHKTNEGPLPGLGQMMVIEVVGEDVSIDALVVRIEPDSRRFAAQFVNLDAGQRAYLAGKIGEDEAADDESSTAYGMAKRKPDPG